MVVRGVGEADMSADWSPTMNLRFCRSQCGVYTFLQQQFTREGSSGTETVWRRVPLTKEIDPDPDPAWRECPFDAK
jgi:hypothetical protein